MKNLSLKAPVCLSFALAVALTVSACGQTAKITRPPSAPTQAVTGDGPTDTMTGTTPEDGGTIFVKPSGPKPEMGGPIGPMGPQGPAGRDGRDGRNADQFKVGVEMPADDEGQDGDQYVWCRTGDVFQKIEGRWTVIAHIKKMKCAKKPRGKRARRGERLQENLGDESLTEDLADENSSAELEADEAAGVSTAADDKKKSFSIFSRK